MPNLKAVGPDIVQGFWLTNFKSNQECLRRNLQKCLENGNADVDYKRENSTNEERERKG